MSDAREGWIESRLGRDLPAPPPMPGVLVTRLRGRRRARAARRAGVAAALLLAAAPVALLWRSAPVPGVEQPPVAVRLTVGPALHELRRANAGADAGSLILPEPASWSSPSDAPLRARDTLRLGLDDAAM